MFITISLSLVKKIINHHPSSIQKLLNAKHFFWGEIPGAFMIYGDITGIKKQMRSCIRLYLFNTLVTSIYQSICQSKSTFSISVVNLQKMLSPSNP